MEMGVQLFHDTFELLLMMPDFIVSDVARYGNLSIDNLCW